MDKRLVSVLMFSFVMAGGTSLVLYRLVISHFSAGAFPAPPRHILVAARNLDPGTLITGSDIRTEPWTAVIPNGAVANGADIIGRGVSTTIFENEPVTEGRLAPKGAGGGLSATIPPGMRAAAVRVNDVAGVAGFVVAGTHVDVLVSGTLPGAERGASGAFTTTLLQNVLVLSAGQDLKRDAEGKPSTAQVVNLLVTPQQAELLSLASGSMTMQLVLRNPLDTKPATAPEVTFASILARRPEASAAKPVLIGTSGPVHIAAPAPQTPPAPETARIEIISGGKRTESTVPKLEARP